MRLLNVNTYELEELQDDERKKIQYAILSHRWGKQELLYEDLIGPDGRRLIAKSLKVRGFCELAQKDGFTYVWIDSCAIDRASSADLNEAVNSMYRWYQEAKICYVYLADVSVPDYLLRRRQKGKPTTIGDKIPGFEQSTWFRRGWTLQELIAPERLEFYDAAWNHIDALRDIAKIVSHATRVPSALLRRTLKLSYFSIAQKMSWAAGRVTARGEDRAYSLLGIFGINMPTNYGEGATKAFIRLQEELIKHSTDQSILAWEGAMGAVPEGEFDSLIADSPDRFRNCGDLIYDPGTLLDHEPYWVDNTGLQMTTRIIELLEFKQARNVLLLNCFRAGKPTVAIGLYVMEANKERDIFIVNRGVSRTSPVTEINTLDAVQKGTKKTITLFRTFLDILQRSSMTDREVTRALIMNRSQGAGLRVDSVTPHEEWDAETGLITLRIDTEPTYPTKRPSSTFLSEFEDIDDLVKPTGTEFAVEVAFGETRFDIEIKFRPFSRTGELTAVMDLETFKKYEALWGGVKPRQVSSAGTLPLEARLASRRGSDETDLNIKLACEDGMHERFFALYVWLSSHGADIIDDLVSAPHSTRLRATRGPRDGGNPGEWLEPSQGGDRYIESWDGDFPDGE